MIVGLTGKKRHGKSTAAQYLASKEFKRINFKDCLIEEIKLCFPNLIPAIAEVMEKLDYDGNRPWTTERLFDEKPPLMRALMQNYGTEVRRDDNPNYWVAQWQDVVTWEDAENIVVDDVRFLNEAQAVKDFGGIIVKIVREDMPSEDTHVSEMEMDKIRPDYTISVKTGEHEKLYTQLNDILQRV